MANQELIDFSIVFKNGHKAHYRATGDVLDQMADDLSSRRGGQSAGSGYYTVQTQDGKPRRLILPFAEVLYIG